MKRVVFVAICVLGIICFSSCRSTSKSCGLADADITIQTTLKQADLL
ncbi:hypothetical protein H9I45_01895 [Polaribacter haliotis]|uniref:Uncharacterized protein n=1 Tax=Polaribacter haliotis TaxID=1888915 RepID=A0A7L8AH02_9FLAO|nr:hypothetical protein [Polaribacter haliotis]QOD61224.1 hypothetical protein H9I45_01895 [Polaribacter haliotis]